MICEQHKQQTSLEHLCSAGSRLFGGFDHLALTVACVLLLSPIFLDKETEAQSSHALSPFSISPPGQRMHKNFLAVFRDSVWTVGWVMAH